MASPHHIQVPPICPCVVCPAPPPAALDHNPHFKKPDPRYPGEKWKRGIVCQGDEFWAVVSKGQGGCSNGKEGGRSSVGDAGYGQVSDFYYFKLSLWAMESHFLLNILDNRHFVQIILFTWGWALGLRRRPGGLVELVESKLSLVEKCVAAGIRMLWVLVVLTRVVCRSSLHCGSLPRTVTVTTSVTVIDSWFVSSLVVFF